MSSWRPGGETGIWLGRTWGGITHRVGVGREVVETRAVQRKPKEERWDVGAVGPEEPKVRNITSVPKRGALVKVTRR